MKKALHNYRFMRTVWKVKPSLSLVMSTLQKSLNKKEPRRLGICLPLEPLRLLGYTALLQCVRSVGADNGKLIGLAVQNSACNAVDLLRRRRTPNIVEGPNKQRGADLLNRIHCHV